ncbi:MAG: lipopolysaccharide transport periplasmic protein LptA [Pseudomonadota bacterium]|nr:lipopolysaccharide transport periplasmic protein LptA [Pseudomonadota bacterium]
MSMVKRSTCAARVGWLLLGLCSLAAAAAEPVVVAPRDEPIYIESDSLNIDDAKGISTYQGNVLFRQGMATLKADTLEIKTRNRQEVQTIVAKGTPARFDQQSPEAGKDASGEALRIEYVAPKSLVIMDGQARFRQGENQFSGNRIEYEAEKKVVRAGKSVAPDGKSGRVHIVIQPRTPQPNSQSSPDNKAVGKP